MANSNIPGRRRIEMKDHKVEIFLFGMIVGIIFAWFLIVINDKPVENIEMYSNGIATFCLVKVQETSDNVLIVLCED